MNIEFKLLDGAQLTRGSDRSCGIDLHFYGDESVILHPQRSELLSTGVSWIVDIDLFGLIKDRSSLACKGLRVGAGIIDADYRDEILVLLMNHSFVAFEVVPGMRIAQLIILRYVEVDVQVIKGDRDGGFGSTGS